MSFLAIALSSLVQGGEILSSSAALDDDELNQTWSKMQVRSGMAKGPIFVHGASYILKIYVTLLNSR